MAEGTTPRLDVIVIVVLLAVMVGGFWMTASAMHERVDALDQKVQVVDTRVREVMDKLVDIQAMIHAQKAAAAPAPAGPAAAPAAPAAPAKPGPAGKPAK